MLNNSSYRVLERQNYGATLENTVQHTNLDMHPGARVAREVLSYEQEAILPGRCVLGSRSDPAREVRFRIKKRRKPVRCVLESRRCMFKIKSGLLWYTIWLTHLHTEA
jgi:hypothetical protein